MVHQRAIVILQKPLFKRFLGIPVPLFIYHHLQVTHLTAAFATAGNVYMYTYYCLVLYQQSHNKFGQINTEGITHVRVMDESLAA